MGVQAMSTPSSHTCGVCGDTATCYRLYGATTVCYSCRIFFRRSVKSKQDLKCVNAGGVLCSFDKLTRNKCRKCRYEKCISTGMNPLLVDSCKKVENHESNMKKAPQFPLQPSGHSAKVVNSIARIQVVSAPEKFSTLNISDDKKILIPIDYSLSGCTRENLTQKYEEVYDNVFLDPQGDYMTKLFEVDKSIIEQARLNKEKIVVPSDYIATYKTISDCIGMQFLRIFLPNFSMSSIHKIACNTSTTILGLTAGLQQCFCNGSMLENIQNLYPCSTAFLQFWKRVVPDIDRIKAVPMEAYAIMTSPWALRIEDEEFVANTFQLLIELICEDDELGKLLCLLALFSPVNIQLGKEETFSLKQFERKISQMIYKQMLSQENCDSSGAEERVGKIGGIIQQFYKCGEIFHDGIIHHDADDNVEDIETIEILEF